MDLHGAKSYLLTAASLGTTSLMDWTQTAMQASCRSTASQPSYDFNQVLLRLVSMLELVLLGLIPSTHFGKELHRAKY